MCLVFIARISNVDILRSKVSEESWNKISDHSDHAKFDRHKPLFTNTNNKNKRSTRAGSSSTECNENYKWCIQKHRPINSIDLEYGPCNDSRLHYWLAGMQLSIGRCGCLLWLCALTDFFIVDKAFIASQPSVIIFVDWKLSIRKVDGENGEHTSRQRVSSRKNIARHSVFTSIVYSAKADLHSLFFDFFFILFCSTLF